MLMMTSRFSIDPMTRGAYMLFAKGMVARTRSQEGCVGFGIFEDISAPDTFIILEQWQSTELFEKHTASPHFLHDDEVLMTFVLGQPSYDEYELEESSEADG
ncbi:MAG: antibiotic biosynthesis monooxygenase [Anaerolineae bacterium]|nr:antibiotic biosynthesis monooxygenase [Anaerolineae bacterium]